MATSSTSYDRHQRGRDELATREQAVAAVSEIHGVMDGIEFETEGAENVMLATLEHEASVDLAEE